MQQCALAGRDAYSQLLLNDKFHALFQLPLQAVDHDLVVVAEAFDVLVHDLVKLQGLILLELLVESREMICRVRFHECVHQSLGHYAFVRGSEGVNLLADEIFE